MKGVRPTEKQNAARIRNWGIRSLRAFYALSHNLSRERGDRVRAIIDEELAERGANTHAQHVEAVGKRWAKIDTKPTEFSQ